VYESVLQAFLQWKKDACNLSKHLFLSLQESLSNKEIFTQEDENRQHQHEKKLHT
jgi:hypothetical protein